MKRANKSNEPRTIDHVHGSKSCAALRHMLQRGVPVTIPNYLAFVGLTRKDLDDAEQWASLPHSIQQLIEDEEDSEQ